MDLKQQWGFSDPRNTSEHEDCDVCANDIFRDSWTDNGVARRAFKAPPAMPAAGKGPAANGSDHSEQLVQLITERVMQQLAQSS